MAKLKCIVDTSAIISLAATNKLELASKIFSFVAPLRVKEELTEICNIEDELGDIAKIVLNFSLIEFINLDEEFRNKDGEIEVINLANTMGADIVVMDDIKARKKLQSKCNVQINFSPFILYVLYYNGFLSYEESLESIERMKNKRHWEENLVIEYAKMLFAKENEDGGK